MSYIYGQKKKGHGAQIRAGAKGGRRMPGRGAYGNKQDYLKNKAYRGAGGAWYWINKFGNPGKMKNGPKKGMTVIANPYKTGLLNRPVSPQASVNPIRPAAPQASAPGAPSPSRAPLDPRSASAYKQMMRDVLDQFNADSFASKNEMAKIYKDGKFGIFEKLFGQLREDTQQQGWGANARMASRGVGRSGAKVKLAQELRNNLDQGRDEYDRQFGQSRFDDLRAALELAKKARDRGESLAIEAGAAELADKVVTPDDADYGGTRGAGKMDDFVAPKPAAAPKPAPKPAKPKVSAQQRAKAQAYHDQLKKDFQATSKKNKKRRTELYRKMLTMRQKYGAR